MVGPVGHAGQELFPAIFRVLRNGMSVSYGKQISRGLFYAQTGYYLAFVKSKHRHVRPVTQRHPPLIRPPVRQHPKSALPLHLSTDASVRLKVKVPTVTTSQGEPSFEPNGGGWLEAYSHHRFALCSVHVHFVSFETHAFGVSPPPCSTSFSTPDIWGTGSRRQSAFCCASIAGETRPRRWMRVYGGS